MNSNGMCLSRNLPQYKKYRLISKVMCIFFVVCVLEEDLRELVRRKESSWRGKLEREEKVSDEERK